MGLPYMCYCLASTSTYPTAALWNRQSGVRLGSILQLMEAGQKDQTVDEMTSPEFVYTASSSVFPFESLETLVTFDLLYLLLFF